MAHGVARSGGSKPRKKPPKRTERERKFTPEGGFSLNRMNDNAREIKKQLKVETDPESVRILKKQLKFWQKRTLLN